MTIREHVLLLAGGVGGAKLALGLSEVLPAGNLTVIVNTADDFQHLGLHVSPDLDTVMYTLAGIANPETGWGLQGDTLQAMEMVKRCGGPDWFNLGDRDIGTNLMRSYWLRKGLSLTEVTRKLSSALDVKQTILPMTDSPVNTVMECDQGMLPFQEYFVKERWQPIVKAIHFQGAEDSTPSPDVISALERATLIVIAPSNPLLSIDPILAVPQIRSLIKGHTVPRVAVSPIIGGQAVKGPAAKLMGELGIEVSPVGVSDYYAGLIDGILFDIADEVYLPKIEALGLKASLQTTIMKTKSDKIHLAEILLHWTEENLS